MMIVDRLEGEYAVCEQSDTEEMSKIPKVLLPSGVQEGDCLVLENNVWKLDAAETIRRRRLVQSMLNDLYN